MQDKDILVWLPSPMGDAILCTPALRAIRRRFESSRITFLANKVVRGVLSPCDFNDAWLELKKESPLATARMLRGHNFTDAILFKNSFGSALAVFLAGISSRIGYAREGRSFLLSEKLHAPRLSGGKFKPISMIDYYLAIASWLGADTDDRKLQLKIDRQPDESPAEELGLDRCIGPIIILVPGGAFGPSKCWPAERYAELADRLIEKYEATIVVSVSSEPAERKIANQICRLSRHRHLGHKHLGHRLINLGENPVSLGQLKSLFAMAELVIGNDTGPRHIATALGRKVVTLFGPNDPAWTETGYEKEIKIVADVACAGCAKAVCEKSEHLCMQSITAGMVCQAAKELLEDNRKDTAGGGQCFREFEKSCFVDSSYEEGLNEKGLNSIDAVFGFEGGRDLVKENLSRDRSRMQFEIDSPKRTVFLKRYNRPAILGQLKNWIAHNGRKSWAYIECESARQLTALEIKTAKVICYGHQWGRLFERRSFLMTEEIGDGQSLEKKLPDFFSGADTPENLRLRRSFIRELAKFVRNFHQSGYRHRDLYLCHIFYNGSEFLLIDLARAFRPRLLQQRYRMKDIAQLYYSAPGSFFSDTDRLRFYLTYAAKDRLGREDEILIRKVIKKAERVARHDRKYGRSVPFEK